MSATPMRLKAIPAPSAELLLHPERDPDYVHFEDAQHHPFDRTAKDFSKVNAWWLADAALLAYWDEVPARPIWARAGLQFEFLSKAGVQCHIGYTDGLVIVAFRGTQPDDFHDLFNILRIRHRPWPFGGSVHEGFRDAHNQIWPCVEGRLERLDPDRATTWFTGHSLGAALAALAMERWPARGLYTIGSPPVGDRRFARGFDQRHAGKSFRYVNHRDLVVNVASCPSVLIGNYTHIKERRYIDASGTISRPSPSITDWFDVAGARRPASRLANRVANGQLLAVPGALVDHTPRRYAVLVWNDYASTDES